MSKILGPQQSICDLIDASMLHKEAQKNYKYYSLRPSAAGKCSRALAYDLMEYHGYGSYPKEEMKPATLRLLSLGHSVEYSALKNMEDMTGFELKYKQQVLTMFRLDPTENNKQGQLIEGSLDAILWHEEYKGLLDVKSVKDGHSAAFRTSWEEKLGKYAEFDSLLPFGERDPKTKLYSAFYADDLESFISELNGDFLQDNLWQLNLYACSPFLLERGITYATVYRYNKNTSQHMEIRFRPSPNLYQKTFEKFNKINKAVASKDISTIPHDDICYPGSFRHAYCRAAESAEALQAWYNTFPKKEWPTKIKELEGEKAEALKKALEEYEQGIVQMVHKANAEQAAVKILTDNEINRIQLDNGHVYEVKYLKTPKPHFELRRSKL